MTDRVDSQEAEDVALEVVKILDYECGIIGLEPHGSVVAGAIRPILARLVREGQARELETVREGFALAAIGGAPYPSIIAALDARIAALKGEG